MEPIDPRVHPSRLPPGCRALVVAEAQDEYHNLPSIVTPDARVITRWALTGAERLALLRGEDIYLTIFGCPIRPVHLCVGPTDWTGVSAMDEDYDPPDEEGARDADRDGAALEESEYPRPSIPSIPDGDED